MKSFFPKKSFEENVDYYAARCPAFVRIIIISTKSFLYYHGMMRAAAMTYNTFLAAIPLLILLTAWPLQLVLGIFLLITYRILISFSPGTFQWKN